MYGQSESVPAAMFSHCGGVPELWKGGGVMHITQPAITHQVRSLEEELGVKLFHRSTHAVSSQRREPSFWGRAEDSPRRGDGGRAVQEKGTPHTNIRIACAFPSQVPWIVEPLSSLRICTRTFIRR